MGKKYYTKNTKKRKVRTKNRGMLSKAYHHKFSVADVAKQVHRLRGIINSELMNHDLSVSTSSYTNSGAISCCTLISQGVDSGRVGLSILAKSFELRLRATIHASATFTTLRLIVFTDNMQQGTLPTVTEVLESASMLAQYEADNNLGRFGKLYDGIINLDSSSKQGDYLNVTIPLGNKHIKFNGTGATQADQGKQSIYVLGISNEATNAPSVDWVSRVRYYDN